MCRPCRDVAAPAAPPPAPARPTALPAAQICASVSPVLTVMRCKKIRTRAFVIRAEKPRHLSVSSFSMSMRLMRSLQLRFLLMVVVSLTGAYSSLFAQEKEPVDVIKVNTDLVVFDVQVIDRKTKRVIGDLKKDDFEVTENGIRQTVSYFTRDELPL